MLVKQWQFFHDSLLNDLIMVVESWKARLQYVFHIVLIYECAHEPERGNLASVIEKNSCNKIHALHVADSLLVIGECNQNPLQGILGLFLLKEFDIGKGALDVGINIRVHLLDHLLQHLAVIHCTVVSHISDHAAERARHVSARNIVALLVKEAFVDFVIAHKVIIVIVVRNFQPFLAISATFLIIDGTAIFIYELQSLISHVGRPVAAMLRL